MRSSGSGTQCGARAHAQPGGGSEKQGVCGAERGHLLSLLKVFLF